MLQPALVNICPRCNQSYGDGVRFCPVDGMPIPQVRAVDPYLGKTLMGQFQIETLAGRGAMGAVYRATQLSMGRTVAIKVLRRELVGDAAAITRFLREARAIARLAHPNIVTVHFVGQADDGAPFIAMEYVDGVSLDAVCKKEHVIEFNRALHITRQIASALGEAHAHGIVHRDLKPENILLIDRRHERDFVKVLDFGIAKILTGESGQSTSQVGEICGTPWYISPEQAAGHDVDARSDLYSLGVVLFRMVTGQLPFDGASAMQVIMCHAREAPPRPRDIRPDLPSAIEAIILRALEKDRAARWQDAEEMIAALAAAVEQPDDNSVSTDNSSRTLHGLGSAMDAPVEGSAAPRRVKTLNRFCEPVASEGESAPQDPVEHAHSAVTVPALVSDDLDEPPSMVESRPSRGAWWLIALAAVGGATLGVVWATHSSGAALLAPSKSAPAPVAVAKREAASWPVVLYQERVIADGPYALRLGFVTPPKQGESATLRMALSDKYGIISGAQFELALRFRDEVAVPVVVSEGREGYLANLSFTKAGRYSLKLLAKLPAGTRFRAALDFEVAAATADTRSLLEDPLRKASVSRTPHENRKPPPGTGARLPVTVFPAADSAKITPRALGPASSVGEKIKDPYPAP